MWGARLPGVTAAPGSEPDDSSIVWMPAGDDLLPNGQPPGAQALAAEGLPLLPSLQAPQALGGLPPLDGAMLDLLPPLPLVSGGSGAAAAAAASLGPGGASSGAAGRADKQAIAREKNRLAQQRFRQKERQKLADAEAEADALRCQLSQLRLQNERLHIEQALLEKLLVVRNAILSVVVQLDAQAQQPQQGQQGQQTQQEQQPRLVPAAAPLTQQGWSCEAAGGEAAAASAAPAAGPSADTLLQDPAALQAASQHLAAALGELPSINQVEHMVGQVAGSSHGGNNGSSGAPAVLGPGVPAAAVAAAAAGGGAPAADPPSISATAEAAAASGLAIDRSRLREVAPSPCPTAQKAVESIDHVECLLEEWRQWRQGLRELFQSAQARQFSDRQQVDALAAHMRSFVEVFWAACHDRPQLFNLFLTRSLPPPSADASAEWARIALESLPLLSDDDVAVFRRAMQRYTKRVAIAAVGVRPWVLRLQAVVAAQRGSLGSMSHVAAQHAQIREVASRLHYACTEHYLAYMGLLSEVSAHTSVVLRALWHSSSDPFAPDHPAIVSQILRLHQQLPQQQLAAPGAPSAAPQQQQAQQAQ